MAGSRGSCIVASPLRCGASRVTSRKDGLVRNWRDGVSEESERKGSCMLVTNDGSRGGYLLPARRNRYACSCGEAVKDNRVFDYFGRDWLTRWLTGHD